MLILWLIMTLCTAVNEASVFVDRRGVSATKEHEFPMQVILVMATKRKTKRCSGVIINAKWVATAGHCVKGRTRAKIGYGYNDKSKLTYVNSDRIVLHEQYKKHGNRYINDIGLVLVRGELPLNGRTVAAARLRKLARIVGWGVVVGWPPHGHPGNNFMFTNVDIQEKAQVSMFPCLRRACANTQTGAVVCMAKGGGVLYVKKEVVGIGSFSSVGEMPYRPEQCYDSRGFDVFTPIGSYQGWINNTITQGKFVR